MKNTVMEPSGMVVYNQLQAKTLEKLLQTNIMGMKWENYIMNCQAVVLL